MEKIGKTEAKKQIQDFFLDIKNKSPEQVKKMKRLAMRHNLPLKEKRKLFCKKCLAPYINPKTRIKKGLKILICQKCDYAVRWKITPS